MAWNEIDVPARIWHIPSQRSKNAKGHLVHLSDAVWGVINGMPRHSRFVFATSGGKNFQSFKRAKGDLDRLSGVIEWQLHDLRRTVVTGMARLGVPPHVADKILNHVQFRELQPCIKNMSSWSSAKMHLSDGVDMWPTLSDQVQDQIRFLKREL